MSSINWTSEVVQCRECTFHFQKMSIGKYLIEFEDETYLCRQCYMEIEETIGRKCTKEVLLPWLA